MYNNTVILKVTGFVFNKYLLFFFNYFFLRIRRTLEDTIACIDIKIIHQKYHVLCDGNQILYIIIELFYYII